MEVDNEVQRLKALKSSYDSTRYGLQYKFMISLPREIKEKENVLENVLKDLEVYEAHKDEDFSIEIIGKTFTERPEAGEMLLDAFQGIKDLGEIVTVGSYKGFTLGIKKALCRNLCSCCPAMQDTALNCPAMPLDQSHVSTFRSKPILEKEIKTGNVRLVRNFPFIRRLIIKNVTDEDAKAVFSNTRFF